MHLSQLMTIRQANTNDFKQLVELWYEASILAHPFIAKEYWLKNKALMQTQYLPNAEVYLVETAVKIYGFIALVEHHIAAIFVTPEYQAKGIGKQLINYAKQMRTHLSLKVYQENKVSINFYTSNGFNIQQETIDDQTNAKEFIMYWQK